jgi:hypothetical protein
MNYLNVADFKAFNPTMDFSSYPDTTLSGIITRMEKRLDSYIGYSLNYELVANEMADGYIDVNGDLVIHPRKRPVVSVTSLELVKGMDSITLALTSGGSDKYNIPTEATSVRYPGKEISTDSVSTLTNFINIKGSQFFTRMSYWAGYQSVPEDILEAVNLLGKSVLASNMNSGGASRIRQGDVEISYSESGSDQFEKDAYNILNDYKRIVPF